MKRGNVSSREKTVPTSAVIIRASINDGEPEPVRVLGPFRDSPLELGSTFMGIPTRLRKALFARTMRIERITDDNGVKIFHCTTAI